MTGAERPGARPPIRVCHMIHSLQRGGAERLLVDLASVAGPAGLQLSVVSLTRAAHGYAQELERRGVRVESLDLATRWDLRAFRRAEAGVRRLRPDLVHTHLKHADLVGAVVARRLGLPTVSTLHLVEDATSGVGTAKRWLAGWARSRWAGRTIAVSESQRRWYLETFPADPARVVTIYNGVLPPTPKKSREHIREALGIPPGAVVAAMVGLMRPGKGHRELLLATREIQDLPDLHVVMAGDGPLREELEGLAGRAPPASPRVVFAGFVDDIDSLLVGSDFLVHPSLAEALPTALLQGLANGLPIVASAIGGIPEIVTDGTGLLVPPGDIEALVAALRRMAGDERLRRGCGAAGRDRFETMFDASLWATRLRWLYEEMLGPDGSADDGRVRRGLVRGRLTRGDRKTVRSLD